MPNIINKSVTVVFCVLSTDLVENTSRNCEVWLVILAICTVAMCKCWGRDLDVVSILILSLSVIALLKNLRAIVYLVL